MEVVYDKWYNADICKWDGLREVFPRTNEWIQFTVYDDEDNDQGHAIAKITKRYGDTSNGKPCDALITAASVNGLS